MEGFDRRQLLNDTEESHRLAMEGHQSNLWTALPGIVQDVDFSEMTCSVQPTIQAIVANPDGSTSAVNLPKLIHCPIIFPSAGGFTITLPLAAGDEVLVIFASRCIDAWWTSGTIGVQAEMRMHDLSDGFVIPGPKSVPKIITGISTNSVQIRTNDGTKYIELTATGINIVGNLHVTGTIISTGEITGNSIPLSAHLHPGVTSGSSDTGAPIP